MTTKPTMLSPYRRVAINTREFFILEHTNFFTAKVANLVDKLGRSPVRIEEVHFIDLISGKILMASSEKNTVELNTFGFEIDSKNHIFRGKLNRMLDPSGKRFPCNLENINYIKLHSEQTGKVWTFIRNFFGNGYWEFCIDSAMDNSDPWVLLIERD